VLKEKEHERRSPAVENLVNNQLEDLLPDFLEPQLENESENLEAQAETIEIQMLEAQALVERGI
jgi:hypothetical protein